MPVELAADRSLWHVKRTHLQLLLRLCLIHSTPVPVSVLQSMPSVTERPPPSKGTIIAQPGPGYPPLC